MLVQGSANSGLACIPVRPKVSTSFKDEFSSRFTDVRSHSQEFKIVSTPFDFPYDDAPSDVQLVD